jgi:hypothetical protein
VPVSRNLSTVAQKHAENAVAHDNEHWTQVAAGKAGKSDVCNTHSWYGPGGCCYRPDHSKPECMWNKPKELTSYPGIGFELGAAFSIGIDAEISMKQWLESPPHREIIAQEGIWKQMTFRAMGIGIRGNFAYLWFGEEEDR